jgi:molybdopterin-guanine dinucleotide biosynthesis protein A
MGTPKADLMWHGQPFADRIARLLLRSTDGPLVVVVAPGQDPPQLPSEAVVVEDGREGRGPLEAIAAGLRALPDDVVAYVSSTDVPLIHPAFVRRVLAAISADVDVAVCETDDRLHPLAAAYRATVLPEIELLLSANLLRPMKLFEHVRTRVLDASALLADSAISNHDPALTSLLNLNAPTDYERAHKLELPEIRIERFGTLRQSSDEPTTVRASTLGAAARAAGVELDRHIVAALNGDQITGEAAVPLVTGDTVAFLSADGGG